MGVYAGSEKHAADKVTVIDQAGVLRIRFEVSLTVHQVEAYGATHEQAQIESFNILPTERRGLNHDSRDAPLVLLGLASSRKNRRDELQAVQRVPVSIMHVVELRRIQSTTQLRAVDLQVLEPVFRRLGL